ncbi:hypothetical protein CC80DRAFT_550448, partial [Byssothecium circinans]
MPVHLFVDLNFCFTAIAATCDALSTAQTVMTLFTTSPLPLRQLVNMAHTLTNTFAVIAFFPQNAATSPVVRGKSNDEVDESNDKLSRSAVLKAFLLVAVCLETVMYSLEAIFARHSRGYHRNCRSPCSSVHPDWVRILKPSIKLLPVFWMVVSIASSAFLYHNKITNALPTTETCPTLSINPDVAGRGVRISLYITGAMAAITAVLGHLHGEVTGIKEISQALFFAQVYYAINLLKGLGWFQNKKNTELSAMDALAGVMVLDAYTSIASVTFSMKECLAARQLIRWGLFLQLFALVIVALVMVKLPTFAQENTDGPCHCLLAFWWERFDACNGPSVNFWLYFFLRCLAWIHHFWLSSWHMGHYDAADKANRTDPYTDYDTLNIGKGVYDSIPATAFTKYWEWLALFISSICSLELTLRSHDLASTDGWAAWSQSAPIIVAILSCLHWSYNSYSMFKPKNMKRRQEVLDNSADCCWAPTLINCNLPGVTTNVSDQFLDILKGACRSHPFLKLRLRLADYTRVEYECRAWGEIRHCYSQFHSWNRDERQMQLIRGAKMGDIRLIKSLLAEKNLRKDYEDIDINTRGEAELTALMITAEQGLQEIGRLLIENEADVNAKNKNGETPLWLAAENGHETIVKLLLDTGKVDVNSKGQRGRTPLWLAAESG